MLDIGVSHVHHHQQYDGTSGGEIQPVLWSELFGNGYRLFNGPVRDGDGYIDGTCNFYALVELGMPGTTQSAGYAVLYQDEQTYFSRRWRRVGPDDGGSLLFSLAADLGNPFAQYRFERGAYWSPFPGDVGPESRLAVAAQVLLVTGDSRRPETRPLIYSTNFSWATMDRTWRWRRLPSTAEIRYFSEAEAAAGHEPIAESADDMIYPQTLRLRDDMTLHLKGRSRSKPSPDSRPSVDTAAVGLGILVHLEGLGDKTFRDGEWAGTKGESRRLEGFQIQPSPLVADLSLRYKAHIQNLGDTPWVAGGTFVGTRGQSLRLEGFQIELTGPRAHNYIVEYRAHVEGIGDTPPARDGQFCGTRGQSLRVEAINVTVIRAGGGDTAALGRWYQRYLPASHSLIPSADELEAHDPPRSPRIPFSHAWKFIKEDLFQLADRFPLFGVYGDVDTRSQYYVVEPLTEQDARALTEVNGTRPWVDLEYKLYRWAPKFPWSSPYHAFSPWNLVPGVLDRKPPSLFNRQTQLRIVRRGDKWIAVHWDKRDDDLLPFGGPFNPFEPQHKLFTPVEVLLTASGHRARIGLRSHIWIEKPPSVHRIDFVWSGQEGSPASIVLVPAPGGSDFDDLWKLRMAALVRDRPGAATDLLNVELPGRLRRLASGSGFEYRWIPSAEQATALRRYASVEGAWEHGSTVWVEDIVGRVGVPDSIRWRRAVLTPNVRLLYRAQANDVVTTAGLSPRFEGAVGPRTWVSSQTPRAGTEVPLGSSVILQAKDGEPTIEESRTLRAALADSIPLHLAQLYEETLQASDDGANVLVRAGMAAMVDAICEDRAIEGETTADRISTLSKRGTLSESDAERLRGITNSLQVQATLSSEASQQQARPLDAVERLLRALYLSDH